jgi:hydroxyacylglutathione hydrolase
MVTIKTIPITDYEQNCRVLWHEGQSEALVIDPGGETKKVLSFLEAQKLTVTEIWLTHSHLDHCGGVAALLRNYPEAKLSANPLERSFRERVVEIMKMYGMAGDLENCPEPHRELTGGEKISFGDAHFEVRFVPGHAPGHLVFYLAAEGVVIAGDTIFAGSIGRTDLPGGNHQTLIASIHRELLSLPDETRVLSGHGPDTTIGRERISNPFLSSRK